MALGMRGFSFVLFTILMCGCSPKNESLDAVLPATAESEYVGNEACASCHEEIYASYLRTGMGRSLSLFDVNTAPEQFSDDIEVYSERFDYYYAPFMNGDTLFQREYRKDKAGNIIHKREHPVKWVIGSGNATRSYLMNVNGHVTQMPLTWYVDKQKWDLSPSYEQQNLRFERLIGQECITCHNALPQYSAYSQNHYSEIPLGISCERCHGPGSEHVDLRLAGLGAEAGEIDKTIVNPAHLDRAPQLSICQQCHLSGTFAFGPGEDMSSFRPGELLSAHRSVFVIKEQLTDPEGFGIASHAQRLARSQCFQQSELTCITCHNPHKPVAELDDNFFNQVCIGCHTPADQDGPIVCSRDNLVEQAEAMTGNCVDCHLQKSGTSDIPHVTFTDHWIRRTLPPPRPAKNIERDFVRTTPFELVRVESEKPAGDADALLEEAIAYFSLYDVKHKHTSYLPQIIQKARAGLRGGADHAEGRLALARALVELDSLQSAKEVLDKAVLTYPTHANLHFWLGEVRMQLKDGLGAVSAFQRAVSLAPQFLQARLKLASAYSMSEQLDDAEAELLRVVAANPTHLSDAWNNLGFVYLQTERLQEATRMFDRAIALDPDLATAWANAGTVHLMQENFDLAAQKFEHALQADPTLISALGNLSLVYKEQGKINEAKNLLRRLLTFQPNEPNALAFLKELEAL